MRRRADGVVTVADTGHSERSKRRLVGSLSRSGPPPRAADFGGAPRVGREHPGP